MLQTYSNLTKIRVENLKYQFVAILLAIVIGIVAGSYFMSLRSDKELLELQEKHKQELKNRVELALKVIEQRDRKVDSLEKIVEQDSIKILSFQKRIEQDGVRIDKLRKDAKNLTPTEKSRWLTDRYK